VSLAYGISCTDNKNGDPRPALQYLINTSEKRKDALVIGNAHPCRSDLAANNLTLAVFVFYCLFHLVYASNKVLNQVLTLRV